MATSSPKTIATWDEIDKVVQDLEKSVQNMQKSKAPEVYPIVKQDYSTDTIELKGWQLVFSDSGVSIKSVRTGKELFKITDAEIIIGNQAGEHIRLQA